MQIQVILNPHSDQGRAVQLQERIKAAARPFGGLDIVATEYPGHGQELARAAVDAGYDIVVAAGGDGTVHEVANGLMRGDRADARLGVIPIGSGNDLAYGLGIPLNDPEAAVARLFKGKEREIDLGRVDDDQGRYAYFDNNFGIGFDAIVVIRTEAITRVHGFLMYLLAVLQTIAFYYETPRVEIRFDDELVSQEMLFVTLGIGPRHGGGFLLTPDAVHNDGLIDSCLVNPIGRLTMLWMLNKAIKGTHVTSRHVSMRQNRRITIKSNMSMPIHIDGEIFAYPKDNVRRVTITAVPNAVKVIV